MATKAKKKKGGHRMKQLGYRLVAVWFKPAALEALEECAKNRGQSLAEWIRNAAFRANDAQRRERFWGGHLPE